MKKIYLLLIAGLFCHVSFGQLNMQFRSNLPYAGQSLANIWGYVDTLGNEYALVGTSTGVSIVNVTNPNSPFQAFMVTGTNSSWREIKTWGKYAYVTTEGGSLGLQIIDLSNLPASVTSSYWTGSGSIAGLLLRAHSLHIDNGYLYLNGTNLFGGATLIIGLTNPTSPTYMSNTQLSFTGNIRYVHDCYVRNDTMYGANIYAGFFTIINVSNKSNPVLVNYQNTPNNFTHNCWLSDDGRKIFTTDETSNSFLASYDISNPNNITYLDKVQSNPGSNSIIHNTYVKNDYAVTSWYKDGVVVVDVSRPDNMIITGFYDTYAQGAGSGFSGCWGVYPYLPSGNIIASDINNGLYVLTPTYVRACYLEGNITNSCNGVGLSNVTVQISGGNSDVSGITGLYKTGTAVAGSYTVTFSKSGYQNTVINNVSLTNGVVTNLNVALLPTTAPVAVNTSVTNATCFGSANGQISTNPTGGVLPLQYLWSNGQTTQNATGLVAGTYTITVTDAGGCSITSMALVTQPAVLIPAASGNSPICKGGNLQLNADPGFTNYLWNGPNGFSSPFEDPLLAGVDGNASGTYTVTVTNSNGCTGSMNVSVQVSDMTITASITHVACRQTNTGAVDITVNGGIGAYSYLWNNGTTTEDLTNRYANTYKVTVTDGAGCTKTGKFSVTNLAPSILSVSTTKTNVRCFGASTGKATLLPSGGLPPYGYSWNTVPVATTATISGLPAGTYIGTVTDAAGCVKVKTITLTQPAQLVAVLTQSNVTVNGGNDGSASVAPSGGTPPYTYSWNTIPTVTTASISNLSAGYYKCKVTDSKSCFILVNCNITQPPLPKIQPLNGISSRPFLYPNPVSDLLHISNLGTTSSSVFLIRDTRGRVVISPFIHDGESAKIEISNLEPGIYFLQIITEEVRSIHKFIKL